MGLCGSASRANASRAYWPLSPFPRRRNRDLDQRPGAGTERPRAGTLRWRTRRFCVAVQGKRGRGTNAGTRVVLVFVDEGGENGRDR